MKETKKNQARPVRLSLEQAFRIVALVDDAIDGVWSDGQKAVMEPLVGQVELVQAQQMGEMHTPGWGLARDKSGDKSR